MDTNNSFVLWVVWFGFYSDRLRSQPAASMSHSQGSLIFSAHGNTTSNTSGPRNKSPAGPVCWRPAGLHQSEDCISNQFFFQSPNSLEFPRSNLQPTRCWRSWDCNITQQFLDDIHLPNTRIWDFSIQIRPPLPLGSSISGKIDVWWTPLGRMPDLTVKPVSILVIWSRSL